MDDNFKQLREEMETFKVDLKAEILSLRSTVTDLEKAAEASSNKSFSFTSASQAKEIETLQAQLKKEKEKVLHLEEYSRRENLIFWNILEHQSENCRELIYDIISNDMGIEMNQMCFHPIHRMGKSIKGKPRPIIVRFVCREDKDRACLS